MTRLTIEKIYFHQSYVSAVTFKVLNFILYTHIPSRPCLETLLEISPKSPSSAIVTECLEVTPKETTSWRLLLFGT